MSVVIDLNKVCLVCLRKTTKFSSIHDTDDETTNMTIVQKISKCSGFDFQLDGINLPDKICELCINDLTATYRFQQNCREANTVFQYIQQQDDEPEVVATLELEQQQITLPLGLKIKKMHSQEVKERQVSSSGNMENIELLEDDEDSLEMKYEDNDVNPDNVNTEPEDTIEEFYMQEGEEFDEEDEVEEFILLDETEKLDNTNAKTRQNTIEEETPVKRGRGRPRKYADKKPSEVNTTKRKKILDDLRSLKICEICGNSYKYQHALKAHMRRHNNERPFSCEFCEKSFVACVELQRHMRVHTGHKPYSCHYCDRRFSDFGSRRKHERTHTGERPYRCKTCDKTFAYAHVLSVHVRTHTGEKRFQCQRCGKGFTKKSYLLTHQNQPGRSACVFLDVNKKISQIDSQEESQEGEFYTIVEQMQDNEAIKIKEENLGLKFEYDEDDDDGDGEGEGEVEQQDELSAADPDALEEDGMSEEHLEEVEDGNILFEIS